MNRRIEAKYLYLTENIYTVGFCLQHVFRTLSEDMILEASQGRVAPVIAPPGEQTKCVTTVFSLSLETYNLPPALDDLVFVLGISICTLVLGLPFWQPQRPVANM